MMVTASSAANLGEEDDATGRIRDMGADRWRLTA